MTAETDMGKVWLVGAGPGDPGLITVKAVACIAEADTIIYDYLSNPVLLEHARIDAEILYVGKRAGHHSKTQPEINDLLVEKAREGKMICRLKGGDPFVFGRGGEEALRLREEGIPFEVVPGVTSAVAVPAYAGIPVTHRGLSVSMRVITGHEDPTKEESDLNWADIASTEGTLIFLMGVRQWPLISEQLINNGKAPETPAAIIANGTRPSQRSLVATVGTLAEAIEAAGIAPPAIIVVGEVASLHDQLNWFEKRPLFGRKIVVTRSRAQASGFAQQLEEAGAEVIQAPAIRIESQADSEAMREAARTVSVNDWVVFTSINAVDCFFEALEAQGMDSRAFGGTKIATMGTATGKRLEAHGLKPDLMPGDFFGKALLTALLDNIEMNGTRFLLPQSAIASPLVAKGLREAGASVSAMPAYRTIPEEDLPEGLVEAMEVGAIDMVTFTSSSTVKNFFNALPEGIRETLIPKITAASIGPATTKTIEEFGLTPAVVPVNATIPDFVEAIKKHTF